MSALRAVLLLCLLLGLSSAYAEIRFRHFEEDEKEERRESEVVLPSFPKDESLLEFYASAVTANRFFIDAESIGVTPDGEVRFALVIKTAGGAINMTYEGLRCDSLEQRIYATGRTDGTWANARNSGWKQIKNVPVNRHHASLSRYYFCPNGLPVRDADAAREALKLGQHPDAN